MDKIDALATTLSVEREILVNSFKTLRPLELNEFIKDIFNKVFKTVILKRVLFKNELLKHFIEEGTSYEAHREYAEVKLYQSNDFEENSKYDETVKRPETLTTTLSTALKKYVMISLSQQQSKAAFANEASLNNWIESCIRNISESISQDIFSVISRKIVNSVKNDITITSTELDKQLIELNTLIDNMMFPSSEYNLDGKGRIKNVSYKDDIIVLLSPETLNKIDGNIMSAKFHNKYFDIKKYSYILLPNDVIGNKVIVISKNSFKGYFRINDVVTQTWAKNITTDYYHHYWLVFGEIPWSNAFSVELT